MPTLLTIAGFDPSSGAGVTADLTVFQAHGMFGTSCITALTVQSTVGVAAVHPVQAGVIAETLGWLEADLPPDGVKIGMLGTAACVDAVAGYLENVRRSGRRPLVVLDPVLTSSSGRALLEAAGVEALKRRLLPLVDWVTPNLEELAALSGVPLVAAADGARALVDAYEGLTVLGTGGEMDPPDDLLMALGLGPVWIKGERVETTSTHGTGCAFSSALLCRLVLGDGPERSAARAKEYVAGALRHAVPIGNGHGPMNLLWPLTSRTDR